MQILNAPSTIPPFHFTKAPKRPRTKAYGTKDGRIAGKICGAVQTAFTRSAAMYD